MTSNPPGPSGPAFRHVTPQEGGCWFCHSDEDKTGQGEELAFSVEFDTYLHLSCLKDDLLSDPNNEEAKIMGEELLPQS